MKAQALAWSVLAVIALAERRQAVALVRDAVGHWERWQLVAYGEVALFGALVAVWCMAMLVLYHWQHERGR